VLQDEIGVSECKIVIRGFTSGGGDRPEVSQALIGGAVAHGCEVSEGMGLVCKLRDWLQKD
jgi:hypothetical protein